MADKPRILIVADWFDPAYKAGGPVRSLINLIEHMHDEYAFLVICGSHDYGTDEPLVVSEMNAWTDWKGMASVYYLSREQQSRRAMFDLLDQTEADVVYVQGMFSLYFSIHPVIWWHQAKREKLVVAPRGMLHQSALRIKSTKKRFFLFASKFMGWYNNVLWHSTNPEETSEIREEMGTHADLVEAPNFPVLATAVSAERSYGEVLRILCVSRISDEKNPLLLLEALSMLQMPVQVTIAGDYLDESYFRRFKKALEALPANIRVHYAGAVEPAALPDLYLSHDLFVLPTRGENFGHAIAEALSHGLPVITGRNTPWSGLEEAGAGWRPEEDAAAFARQIEAWQGLDKAAKQKMAAAAVNFVAEKLQTDKIREAYRLLFTTENNEEYEE